MDWGASTPWILDSAASLAVTPCVKLGVSVSSSAKWEMETTSLVFPGSKAGAIQNMWFTAVVERMWALRQRPGPSLPARHTAAQPTGAEWTVTVREGSTLACCNRDVTTTAYTEFVSALKLSALQGWISEVPGCLDRWPPESALRWWVFFLSSLYVQVPSCPS